MARPLRIEFPGAFYHITSRGNERKPVFHTYRDREKFLAYLESATNRYGAVIHVYCLMETHYHLFIETPSGNLSKIMQHINGAYTTYFNRKHERAGHLFQGRYKSILVQADAYAKELSRYIHLNPVRSGIVNNPEEYEWSSFRFYISDREFPKWLKRDMLLGYFNVNTVTAMSMYKDFVHGLIGQKMKSPLENLRYSFILGEKEYIGGIKKRFLRDKKTDRNLPGLREVIDRPELDTLEKMVDSEIQSDEKLARQVKLYLSHSFSGRKLREIGARFNVSDSGVTQASRRIRDRQKADKKLEKLILKIFKRLKMSNV
jgi:putative transposase